MAGLKEFHGRTLWVLCWLILHHSHSLLAIPLGGRWDVLVTNAGVSAMHMTLTHMDTVIYFDMTDIGASELPLPDGRCRLDEQDLMLKNDCWAHAAEYNIATKQIRPLEVQTDPWCSSGSFLADGTLVQTGGWNDGSKTVRYLDPSETLCDWVEAPNALQDDRWYGTSQILPDNRIIVVGGRKAYNYEFIPTRSSDEGLYNLALLKDTDEDNAENNLYPFVHLSSDDTLFIFANRDSVLLDYKTNKVLKAFPRMPGNGSRNYPSSGSSVILPLQFSDGFLKVEVMICGGSPPQAFQETQNDNYLTALDSCGRLVITDHDPKWFMETMPSPRVMGDMIILPTGELLLVNGAQSGTAGWGLARNPVLSPYLYRPGVPKNSSVSSRWEILATSTIPRLYHSSAVLMADGRMLVAGSNTNIFYNSTDVMYPTELRMETFSPHYLDSSLDNLRPTVINFAPYKAITYNSTFEMEFQVADSSIGTPTFEFRLHAPPFCTHSLSMNQRQLVLEAECTTQQSVGRSRRYKATITAPPSAVAAPGGFYLLFIVHFGVPSTGQWVQFLGIS